VRAVGLCRIVIVIRFMKGVHLHSVFRSFVVQGQIRCHSRNTARRRMKYLDCTGVQLNFFVPIPCNFRCFKPFLQLGKGVIKGVLKPVAFDVVSNDTGVINQQRGVDCLLSVCGMYV